MIIRGGENIYPREIDEVLYQHPGIAAAAAVGSYPLADVRDCGASWRAHADAPDAVLLDARLF